MHVILGAGQVLQQCLTNILSYLVTQGLDLCLSQRLTVHQLFNPLIKLFSCCSVVHHPCAVFLRSQTIQITPQNLKSQTQTPFVHGFITLFRSCRQTVRDICILCGYRKTPTAECHQSPHSQVFFQIPSNLQFLSPNEFLGVYTVQHRQCENFVVTQTSVPWNFRSQKENFHSGEQK